MTVDPYGRTTQRDGVTLNFRTLEMFEITELRAIDFGPLELSQGSYTSATPQSGGTHAGGGALDVSVRALSSIQRRTVVAELRRTGFAAWLRTPAQGDWPYHIHAVAIGDQELSSAAGQQVTWYRQGYNGLWGPPDENGNPTPDGPDDGPAVSWREYRQEIDLSYYGPQRWDAADFDRFYNQAGWGRNIVDGRDVLRNADRLLSMVHENGFQAEDAAKAAASRADEALAQLGTIEQTLANQGQQLAAINAKLGIEIIPATP